MFCELCVQKDFSRRFAEDAEKLFAANGARTGSQLSAVNTWNDVYDDEISKASVARFS